MNSYICVLSFNNNKWQTKGVPLKQHMRMRTYAWSILYCSPLEIDVVAAVVTFILKHSLLDQFSLNSKQGRITSIHIWNTIHMCL